MYASPTLWALLLFLLGLFYLSVKVNPNIIPEKSSPSLSLSHLPMQISAMHFAFNNTWMRKSLKWEKDVQYVKMSYLSLVIIRECHKRRNVPKRVLHNSNSGNCVLSKDFVVSAAHSFTQKIFIRCCYIQHCVNITKALNLQSTFLFYTYVDTFRWGLKFSTQLNALFPSK